MYAMTAAISHTLLFSATAQIRLQYISSCEYYCHNHWALSPSLVVRDYANSTSFCAVAIIAFDASCVSFPGLYSYIFSIYFKEKNSISRWNLILLCRYDIQ